MATTAPAKVLPAGLEDVVIGQSSICDVNGTTGQLIYRGYDIHDLVRHTSFEEVVYLLWHGALPTGAQLAELTRQLRACFALPVAIVQTMRGFPKDAEPMDVLRSTVSQLSFFDPEPHAPVDAPDVNLRRATRLTAQFASIVGAWQQIRNGRDPVGPDPSRSFAANVLRMLRAGEPDELDERAFNTALVLHADHEINASTFAARVTAATLADMYAAIVSAIGTLSGPLHGGANSAVMEMLLEIRQSGEDAAAYVRQMLADKRKVMGFGHRVYKTEDPRATHLRRISEELGTKYGDPEWFRISRAVEETVRAERGLYANVDFYSASTYYVMGLPIDLYTPLFAVSRISGWTAHLLEQYANNRLIRPRAEYVGPRGLTVVPVDQRK